MKKKKSLLKALLILLLAIFVFILGLFAYVWHMFTSMNSSSHTPVLTTSEAKNDIQKMFSGVDIDVSNASGYSESRWPGEYVSYYRFYAPPQDIDNV
jgi:flagellar basal body-associated protein FliL